MLIVEDDPDTLVILRVNLNASGIEPILAADGRTAIARIQAEDPDAVLLDVLLPGVDGWEVLEELHALGDPVPVIVCSGKNNPRDIQRARELGAVGVPGQAVRHRQADRCHARGRPPEAPADRRPGRVARDRRA